MGAPVSGDTSGQIITRAVDDLARRTRFPVVFAGIESEGTVEISAIAGTRTHAIDGLAVTRGRGLGGAAMIEKRPRLALDYRTARTITHDYDRAILGEGISTLFAVPIVVGERARGLVYCGSWSQSPVGDLVAAPAFKAAEAIASELRVRDEVDRRVAALTATGPTPTLSAIAQEDLRESFAELRSIAASVTDQAIRERLAAIERRLAGISRDDTAAPAAATDVKLAPRELDVLARCALGETNAEIGDALSLREATVKSYLQSAMAKLDASTRHAAVTKARRAGILP